MVAPFRSRSTVCKLNEENVVNPPQKPIMTNNRVFSERGYRPCARVSVPKKPMINDPAMLMAMVPQGRFLLSGSAAEETQYRAIVPNAPPAAKSAYV